MCVYRNGANEVNTMLTIALYFDLCRIMKGESLYVILNVMVLSL